MDGTNYVPVIRRILNDLPTPNYQGSFWADYEIRLALNLSQHVFLRYAIQQNQKHLLSKLINTTPFGGPVDTYFRNPNNPKLLYPLKALVAQPNDDDILQEARIYYADSLSHLDAGQSACYIFQNLLIYRVRVPTEGRSIPTKGQLVYIKYPGNIFLTTDTTYVPTPNDLVADYELYVYEQFIVPYACVILGMKEITNQRDFKLWKNYIATIFSLPPKASHFVQDYEFTGEKIRPGRPPNQDIGEPNE